VKAFEYRAATAAGALVEGTAWASSEAELDDQLDARGLLLTRAKRVSDPRGSRDLRLGNDDLIHLTNQLATTTSAGVPIVEGLRGIGERLASGSGRAVVGEMVTALEAGATLSSVMGSYPKSFSPVYRSSVRAGEESGALETVLLRLAKHLEWTRGVRATAVQALVYPAILCGAIAVLIGILLYFVLPRIVSMFPGGVDDLPAQTRVVMAVSEFLRANWLPVLGVVAGSVVAFATALRRPRGRLALDHALLKTPRLGAVAAQIATSKFAGTASTLQSSGCDVFTVLEVASSTCGNSALAAAFDRATERVRRGEELAEALGREPLIDPLLVQMVGIGEKTGRLDDCLAKVVEHYDDEVPRGVKRFLSVFEPALLVGAGVVVAFILLSALLPIFDLYDSIG